MKKLSNKIIKIYNERAKAYETLLECDIELDKLLHLINIYENTTKTKNSR